MHERYRHHRMEDVWSTPAQYKRWLDIERAIATAGVAAKVVPSSLPDLIQSMVRADSRFIEDCQAEEMMVRHDVAAFITVLERYLRPRDEARFVHFGATSSDVVDTALAMATRDAGQVLVEELGRLDTALAAARDRWFKKMRVGRTHGRIAGTVLVDQMLYGFQSDLWFIKEDVDKAGVWAKFGGPLGDFPIIPFATARRAFAEVLSVEVAQFTTQVVSRDSLVLWCGDLERVSYLVEKIATWIRFESIEGVDQLKRAMPAEEIASSSMPHKNNPVVAENLCGLMRMVRANLRAVADSSVLWADRDMSHSSVERVALPDACVLLAHGLRKLSDLFGQLELTRPTTRRPAETVPSFDLLHILIRDGMSRAEAHAKLRDDYR